MSHENLNRRALVVGAASIPALALPAVAMAATEPDPIFAAIEAHREIFVRMLRAARHNANLDEDSPAKEEAEASDDAARAIENDAQLELANVEPTTLAGVLALLAYLDDLYVGAIAHPEDPRGWHSGGGNGGFLNDFIEDEVLDKYSGKPLELPLMFWIARNVGMALQKLAVRS